MLMVIFGAGASFDSAPHRPPPQFVSPPAYEVDRLPLADSLFADRRLFADVMKQFPKCLPIIDRLRERGGRTVEEVLEQLQAEADAGVHESRHAQLMAIRYYLQVMLWGCQERWKDAADHITNYMGLLDGIEQSRLKTTEDRGYEALGSYRSVCLVTFNYDTLIEDALATLPGRARPTEMHHYIADPTYKLIKAHGSINWAREVKTSKEIGGVGGADTIGAANRLIDNAPSLEALGTRVVVGGAPSAWIGNPPMLVVPALAVPLQRKTVFECPREHLEALMACATSTRKLLIIGWRGTEDHFTDLLATLLPRDIVATVVAKDQTEAAQTEQRLASVWKSVGGFRRAHGGFTHFVRHEMTAFLKG